MKVKIYHYNPSTFKLFSEGFAHPDEVPPYSTTVKPPAFNAETECPRWINNTWTVLPIYDEQEQKEKDIEDTEMALIDSDAGMCQAVDTLFQILLAKKIITINDINVTLMDRLNERAALRSALRGLKNEQ